MHVEVIQTDAGVFYDKGGGELVAVPCQWFALCDNDAVTTEEHPVLGSVPICGRCGDRVSAAKA